MIKRAKMQLKCAAKTTIVLVCALLKQQNAATNDPSAEMLTKPCFGCTEAEKSTLK